MDGDLQVPSANLREQPIEQFSAIACVQVCTSSSSLSSTCNSVGKVTENVIKSYRIVAIARDSVRSAPIDHQRREDLNQRRAEMKTHWPSQM